MKFGYFVYFLPEGPFSVATSQYKKQLGIVKQKLVGRSMSLIIDRVSGPAFSPTSSPGSSRLSIWQLEIYTSLPFAHYSKAIAASFFFSSL